DPDQDGFTNEQEFVAGTNPRDGESFLRFQTIGLDVTGLKFGFTVPSRRSYSVLQKENVQGGSWATLTNVAAELEPRTVEVADPNTNATRFYRLVAPATP
ncbi:MAG: hypothetical protein ACK4UN_20185, partial [Limisphaerales bacterium]